MADRTAYVLSAGGIANELDAQTGARVRPPLQHTGWVFAAEFSRDGKRLLTTDYVGGIRCWNYAEDRPAALWSRAPRPRRLTTANLRTRLFGGRSPIAS